MLDEDELERMRWVASLWGALLLASAVLGGWEGEPHRAATAAAAAADCSSVSRW
jgi:hypothetical protein